MKNKLAITTDVVLTILILAIIAFIVFNLPHRTIKISPAGAEMIQIVNGEITAYSPTVDQCDNDPLINAMNRKVQVGDIACPGWLEFGQKVRIADKIYTCRDRMNKRYRFSKDPAYFDIFFWSRQNALNWGRRQLPVEIL